jgi:hypothetical protein
MLEQAIVDAKALREAAVKSAEAAIVEKYNDEVKDAVSKLLEQDDEMDLGMGMEPEAEVEVDSTAMEQVPMAHLSDDDEDIVVVDLDDIIAAAESEEGEEEAVELDREEVADEVGLPLDDEMPANRDDEELELNENELVDMFKEMLRVDIPQVELDRAEESLTPDQVEQDEDPEVIEAVDTDGMDEEDAENLRRSEEQNESLQKENAELKQLLGQVQATSRASKRKIRRNKLAKRKIIICEPCAWRFLLE